MIYDGVFIGNTVDVLIFGVEDWMHPWKDWTLSFTFMVAFGSDFTQHISDLTID